MALWVVTARGAPSDEEPDLADLGGQFVAAHRAGGNVEMLVEGDRAMIERLARLPSVLCVAPALDGTFADDADGTVVVSDGGTTWRRAPQAKVG